jgi:hypothetical protein
VVYLPLLGAVRIPKFTLWGWVGLSAAVGVYLFLLAVAFQLALGSQGCTVANGLLAGWCGSKTGLMMAVAIIFLPPAIIFAVKRPWLFPAALYALCVPSDSYLSLGSGATITKLAGGLALAALLFWIIRKRSVVNPGVAAVMWIGYFLWSTATLLWAINSGTNIITYYTTFTELVVLFLAFVITPIDEKEFNMLFAAFIVGSCIAAIFGAIVFHSGAYLNQGRLKAHFDSANKLSSDFFACSMVFPIGVAVMSALRERWGIKKIAYLIVFVILLVGQYVAGSRGALVADVATVGYFFWMNRYRAQLVFVSVCGLLVSFLYPAVWLRFVTPDVHGGDNGGSGRIPIWKIGFEAWKHYWLFGAGINNFPAAYNQSFLSVWNTFYTGWNRGPHNIILEAAVELGIFGLAFLLLGWWTTFRSLRHIPIGHRFYDLRIMIEGGIFGTFVNAIFVHIMLQKFTWWMFAITLMAATMTRAVIARERVILRDEVRAGPTPIASLPPQPVLGRAPR